MFWQPTASIDDLAYRAQVLADVRQFFAARGVMEVDVPALGASTVTDVNLDSLRVASALGHVGYLQTSPEYFMKRLLAAGSGAVYYLGKAFRSDECGRNHNPEFTMLEWYRPGYNDTQLMAEVADLCRSLKPELTVVEISYKALFERHCGLNPHLAPTDALGDLARASVGVDWQDEPRSVWLDLLFSHRVEPLLTDALYVVNDFPSCQAALARLGSNAQGETVAKRFEVYWLGRELANGYWELTDPVEQRSRFAKDNLQRQRLGKAAVEVDTAFLAALDYGLPDCAGVALGVDRLLMCLAGKSKISQVMSFAGAALAP